MSAALKLYSPDSVEPAATPDLATLTAKIDELHAMMSRLEVRPAESPPLASASAPLLLAQPPDSAAQNPGYMIRGSGVGVPAESLDCLPPLGRLTLREVYERHLKAGDVGRVKERSIRDYYQTILPRWEALGTSAPKRWYADQFGQMAYQVLGEPISDPPVAWIVSDDLVRFATAHFSERSRLPYSAGSYKSPLAQIKSWLVRLRPQASGGLGAIFIVPIVSNGMLPVVPIKPHFVPSDEQIQRLFEVSPLNLKCLLACVWTTGLRRGDAKCLKWSHFSEDLQTLSFVASKTERKRPHPKNLPLHPSATAWLQWAKTSAEGGQPTAHVFDVLINMKKFSPLWKACLVKAGLSNTTKDARQRDVEQFTLKRMRAACNELLNDQGERAGEFVLHSSSSVNSVSYSRVYDPTPEQRRLIVSAPVPDWLWPAKT